MKKPKSWRQGYEAAKRGEFPADCPYQLDDEAKKILIKRSRWLSGYENWAFRIKSPKQIRKALKQKVRVVDKSKGYGVGLFTYNGNSSNGTRKKKKSRKSRDRD